MAHGMKYLHDQNIVIQDLKPENIGFDSITGKPRLFDLGFARSVEEIEKTHNGEPCGTPRDMSPEVLAGKKPSKESDMYSFGCILYAICTLKLPFPEATKLQHFDYLILHAGKRPSLKNVPNRLVRELISECWAQDPKERPSFDEIVGNRLPAILDFEGERHTKKWTAIFKKWRLKELVL